MALFQDVRGSRGEARSAAVLAAAVVACWFTAGGTAQAAPPFTRITSGFELNQAIRPALADDGTVVSAETERLQVGDGGPVSIIDLAPSGLEFNPGTASARAVQVRDAGDIVLVADHPGVMECAPFPARGVYRTDTVGAPVTSLFEGCFEAAGAKVGPHVGLSPNGTMTFSTIVSSEGAIYRGPVAGPVSVLRSGTGIFFNNQEIVVNDFGQVAVQMEYGDPDAGLRRGILIFETPEQDLVDIDTAIERVGIQPFIGLNANGLVAFSSNFDFTMVIDGTPFNFTAGVYVADPTLFNTEKMLTQIADKSGDFCGFGHVDINDAGKVVFEAQVDGGLSGCGGVFAGVWDGIYSGSSPAFDRVVTFGDAALEEHQFFDSVLLGEINNADQVSFLTAYSEPLVAPTVVWRAELDEVDSRNRIRRLLARWWRLIRRLLRLFGF